MTDPSNASHLLLISKGRADVVAWTNFKRVSSEDGICLESENTDRSNSAQVISSRQGQTICLNYLSTSWQRSLDTNKVEVWDTSKMHPSTTTNIPSVAYYDSFPSSVKEIF